MSSDLRKCFTHFLTSDDIVSSRHYYVELKISGRHLARINEHSSNKVPDYKKTFALDKVSVILFLTPNCNTIEPVIMPDVCAVQVMP